MWVGDRIYYIGKFFMEDPWVLFIWSSRFTSCWQRPRKDEFQLEIVKLKEIRNQGSTLTHHNGETEIVALRRVLPKCRNHCLYLLIRQIITVNYNKAITESEPVQFEESCTLQTRLETWTFKYMIFPTLLFNILSAWEVKIVWIKLVLIIYKNKITITAFHERQIANMQLISCY